MEAYATGSVSSPGFGIINSGCGRALIGQETLAAWTKKLAKVTKNKVETYAAVNQFCFGNGTTETLELVLILVGGIITTAASGRRQNKAG